jgi:hypothetical protein
MKDRRPGVVVDCACGLRYMRSTSTLTAVERASAHCPCQRPLEEWQGIERVIFEAEDPAAPAIFTRISLN